MKIYLLFTDFFMVAFEQRLRSDCKSCDDDKNLM